MSIGNVKTELKVKVVKGFKIFEPFLTNFKVQKCPSKKQLTTAIENLRVGFQKIGIKYILQTHALKNLKSLSLPNYE